MPLRPPRERCRASSVAAQVGRDDPPTGPAEPARSWAPHRAVEGMAVDEHQRLGRADVVVREADAFHGEPPPRRMRRALQSALPVAGHLAATRTRGRSSCGRRSICRPGLVGAGLAHPVSDAARAASDAEQASVARTTGTSLPVARTERDAGAVVVYRQTMDERRVARKAEVAELLLNAARQLGETLEPERAYECFHRLLGDVVQHDGLVVSSYDERDDLIRCEYAWVEGNVVDPATLPPLALNRTGGGMQSRVIVSGEPYLFNDVAERVEHVAGVYYNVDREGTVK